MERKVHNRWKGLSPPFPESGVARDVFRKHAMRLSDWLATSDSPGVVDPNEILEETLGELSLSQKSADLRATLYLLTDLAQQRWSIRVTEGGDVEVARPDDEGIDPAYEKSRIRSQELLKRDEQLRERATQKFIKRMENKYVFNGKFFSIHSVIRDGRELAESLRTARRESGAKRVQALRAIVDPYIQFVDDKEYCEYTGLRLRDIWRYFRHTWSNQYMSTPGRSMAFLVRDRACESRPVIGIGAIGSPIVQIQERDSWIGWQPQAFLEFVTESPSAEVGVWLGKTIEKAINELYIDDFVEEQLLSPSDVRSPSPEVLARLSNHSEKQRQLHHRLARSQDLRRGATRSAGGRRDAQWEPRARTHLYRSKRALALADMLWARMVLQSHLSNPPTLDEVRALVASADGRQVVKKVLRKAKSDRVGIAMADITVCGAIAPYNPILGGKLVSMLAVSPEVVNAYQSKYMKQQSEIASSMAGRAIIRPSQLAFMGTTSLYGVGSSQYNRLKMPAERIGGSPGESLSYLELGKSQAYGTSHFSSGTVDALVALMEQSRNGQRVNSIFGEGVSPKFRKIRGGLEALNLPSDTLLQHGRQRIVYGVPLIRNLREYLLGMDEEPDYIFDMSAPASATAEIAKWWVERWLSKRIDSEEVLNQVERNTLVRPVRHGAIVNLPSINEDQASLFDDFSC